MLTSEHLIEKSDFIATKLFHFDHEDLLVTLDNQNNLNVWDVKTGKLKTNTKKVLSRENDFENY